jgi:Ala-tRNA(Pro) deacylase
VDGKPAMAVLPANRKVVLQDLLDITGSQNVRFASEREFANRFPDCEVGAMPPFGNLYGMDVYVAPALAEDEQIAFNAGSHRRSSDVLCGFAWRCSRALSFTT